MKLLIFYRSGQYELRENVHKIEEIDWRGDDSFTIHLGNGAKTEIYDVVKLEVLP